MTMMVLLLKKGLGSWEKTACGDVIKWRIRL